MKDILDEIIANKREEVEARKAQTPFDTLLKRTETYMASGTHNIISMKERLTNSRSGIISEFKRKSPSKGWIHEDSEVTDIVPQYARNGAAAISILTDERFFGGRLDFITQVREKVQTPILRKDFVIDEYQLLEARTAGADAVLLIAACLTPERCKQLLHQAHQLGLEALLEIHDKSELDYLQPEVDMLGVNNRNLGTFHTDVNKSFEIIDALPKSFTLVSESGIDSPTTVKRLREAGYRGFLIGENFMKEPNPGEALLTFVQQIEKAF